MRNLLEYTRSGRWQTLVAETEPEIAPELVPAHLQQAQQRPAAVAIKRLLDFTRTGHWRTLDAATGLPELEAADQAQLLDDSFFGVDVHEIPADKWPEIAPLFPR